MKPYAHSAIIAVLVFSNIYLFYRVLSADRLAYVDSSKLINGYNGMVDARKVYQQKAFSWKAKLDTLMMEVQGEIQKYEKANAKMSAGERELQKKLIQVKQQQLADYQKITQEKAAKEDGQMTQKVIDEINAYIKEYGKQKGLKIIIAATDYGNVAYADETLDITNEILEGLNKRYAGK